MNREWLQRAAVHYLERYASSAENLRRVLERKVLRRTRESGEDPAIAAPMIDAVIESLLELKLLDDAAFAEAKVRSLRRRGVSTRHLALKLNEKGVRSEAAANAIERDETTDGEAALTYARRRRLGPFRLRDREERRDRDLQAMMRAGYAFGEALAVIDGDGKPGSVEDC